MISGDHFVFDRLVAALVAFQSGLVAVLASQNELFLAQLSAAPFKNF